MPSKELTESTGSRRDGSATDVLPFEAVTETLANGLRVIVVPTGFPNLVALQIPVQTGSRNEVEPGKSGFAHFFEHMMFRGTERYPTAAYEALMTAAGARHNAYTTDDYTNYHTTFAREDLETVLALEADRFQHLSFSEEDFRTEARAVLGEYNKSSANPLTKLVEVQRDHAFRVHPYKHTTMGFLADIEAMPEQVEYARTFFRRWYRPDLTTVIVAGDVEPDETVRLVEKHWGGWRGDGQAVLIPRELPAEGPVVAHVSWDAETLPWLTLAFHGPAFSETEKGWAALDMLLDLRFGETSDVHRQLVEEQQLVDRLFVSLPATADPQLATILTRVKRRDDLPRVRDALLAEVAAARRESVLPRRLADAKANARYGFARTLDNTESIAAALARFVRFRRSYDTLNGLFRLYDALTPDDLLVAARTYCTDARLVQTTLTHEPPPAAMESVPALATYEPAGSPAGETSATTQFPLVLQRTPLPLLRMKLLFGAGSAHDPPGREGLAALSAAMIAEAGSVERRFDQITRALFPLAAGFDGHVDREMTVFTGVVHRDNAARFVEIALPQLLRPGFREADFERLRARQRNALVQDLRANNDEELGRERLQTSIFAGTPYDHPALGTVASIDAITLADVRGFVERAYCRANLTLGLAGDLPDGFTAELTRELAALPMGQPMPAPAVAGRRPRGLEVEIVRKETRATAISFGHPLAVTRGHPDFAALWLARAWLGEHRASLGRLFQRLREARGLNYGDYAYIEAFPYCMYRLMPEPNVARQAQLFEVWIRPVEPEHAVFALKAALFELRRFVEVGLSEQEFEATRAYLMKNVYLLVKTQDQQLGYALDSRWYGIGEFTATMRGRLQTLTVEQVNAALRRHLSADDLAIVVVTEDADALRRQLLSGTPGTIRYDGAKPAGLLEEDRAIGALDLKLTPDRVRITPVEAVFAG